MLSTNAANSIGAVFLNESDIFKRLLNLPLQPTEAILVFTGYGFSLCDKAHELYKAGYSDKLCVFGDNSYPWKANPKADSIDHKNYLHTLPGVKEVFCNLVHTGNTKQASETALEKMQDSGWNSALLVTCWYHMQRAYSTFVKAMLLRGKDLHIVPAPYEPSVWADTDQILEMSWTDALKQEKERIERYRAQADVATKEELSAYIEMHFNQSTFISQRFLNTK